ncbi:hypothetical protein [Fluviispira sanaruensis]|nr:hypothetical protein [Fluviispira sanaruensis]
MGNNLRRLAEYLTIREAEIFTYFGSKLPSDRYKKIEDKILKRRFLART